MSESDRRYYLSIRGTPKYKVRNAQHRKAYRQRHPKYNAEYGVRVKIEVLSHYGPQGRLQCAWPDCAVTDVDMLSLDHINNDGAHARHVLAQRNGVHLYHQVRKNKYPDGFQTLCHNHQWKKEIMRRREVGT